MLSEVVTWDVLETQGGTRKQTRDLPKESVFITSSHHCDALPLGSWTGIAMGTWTTPADLLGRPVGLARCDGRCLCASMHIIASCDTTAVH